MIVSHYKHYISILTAGLFGIITAPVSEASIGISFGDPIGDPTTISIAPGNSFVVTVQLTATAEQLIGVNYSLTAPGGGSGKFTLVSRSTVGSPFSFMTIDNVANTPLTTTPSVDLGALLENVGAPVQPGTRHLAQYTIASDPSIAPGVYTLQVGPNPFGLGPVANEIPASGSSYQVNVVPEPGTAALACGGLALVYVRRRHRS